MKTGPRREKSLKPAMKEQQRKTKVSSTDPDSGFMHRTNKPRGFFYLDHRSVEGKVGIITDTYATPGNADDSQPFARHLKRFFLMPLAVGLVYGPFVT
ncbi:transposase for IS1668 [Photorhabdus temperata subsp. temperata M1021]|uniref:Transposase DDE domain-containing protein n=1 Tax=Photorhabdus temperata J3 TaxID=1389415 RepID=U7QZM7_PHOTE|nr:transposase for IS1668 [Photorhabdus temperata subsp. temperata M1021]ERT13504.1 hypothetical protein O185_08500 [Photorhabdus temperata J3]